MFWFIRRLTMNNYTAANYINGPKVFAIDQDANKVHVSFNVLKGYFNKGTPVYFTANDIENNYGLMMHIDAIFTVENDGTTYYMASGMFNDSEGNINTPFFVATDADADLNSNL